MIPQHIEVLNATLALSVLILILVIARDFKKEFRNKDNKIQIPLSFFGVGIFVLSIKELYKGPFLSESDPVIAELLETIYLLLILVAFFTLLGIKELHLTEPKK